jgi:hypothetical protein
MSRLPGSRDRGEGWQTMSSNESNVNWIFPQDQWQNETKNYAERIMALKLVSKRVEEQIARFPGLLNYEPSLATSVKHRTLIFANHGLASAQELLGSIQLLWTNGHLLAAGHCARLLFEIWSSLLYTQYQILAPVIDGGDAEEADKLLQKLLLGTSSGPLLPGGIQETIDLIPIGKFKNAAEKCAPGYKNTYSFLCDIAHPTYMHCFFHHIRYDFAWSNRLGKKETRRILERVVSVVEQAIAGIQASVVEIYTDCVPAIESETARWRASRPQNSSGD